MFTRCFLQCMWSMFLRDSVFLQNCKVRSSFLIPYPQHFEYWVLNISAKLLYINLRLIWGWIKSEGYIVNVQGCTIFGNSGIPNLKVHFLAENGFKKQQILFILFKESKHLKQYIIIPCKMNKIFLNSQSWIEDIFNKI